MSVDGGAPSDHTLTERSSTAASAVASATQQPRSGEEDEAAAAPAQSQLQEEPAGPSPDNVRRAARQLMVEDVRVCCVSKL